MSAEYSVGVEEEYQLVDPASGALTSRAPEVLDEDWGGELQAEMQQTMLEVGTPICGSAEQVRAELLRLRFQAACVSAARGLAIAAAGVHPDDAAPRQRRSPGERYARIAERLGRVARTDHIFGMHVHVALPPEVDRVRLIGRLRAYLPHLIALAASSPLYAGEDTGFDSYRTILAGRLPNAGMPPAMESEAEFVRFVEAAVRAGLMADEASLYWSLRPHSRYPTLEFRACDVCPRVEDAAAITALVRAMVAAAVEGGLTRMEGFGAGELDALLRANEWQAARFGLEARLATSHPCGGCVRDGIRRLVDRVAPVAEALGDGDALAGIEWILERGNAAQRIRRLGAEGTGEVARWLAAETLLGTGADRRSEQRHEQTVSAG
jgi:glutamate---cysteine ligase / carboxylate-amine ligase